jgi:hypothetical protein
MTKNRWPVYFRFELGLPGQQFRASIDFNKIDFVVVDATCGQVIPKCPRYCDSGKCLILFKNVYKSVKVL